ncbi:5-carboxymethyl-2-hydroxymuconate isomerase [Vibrio sp. SS-MA-C1-2]|uniref:5-carboxymethyl-2-hydroxymuconate isomerase n=1 Tax=Vibrio sp. SS-MA-C1-2 TaxID=2908646 RepID=UPI001F35EDD5|nr:5-carboxymethyl-2-hydroxymuconate isomerase [Vibrio sp. SS-MA-C1-2]UJF19420.1 5-carboxymethyl-2-hydroxymuconate isomerase [Vibrio sp. SS-MA-C1-2]
MPHLIMEYSDPVTERMNTVSLLEDLHLIAVESGYFNNELVVSRSYSAHNWFVGSALEREDFIHLTLNTSLSLDIGEKKQLIARFMTQLQQQAEGITSLTVDINAT